MRTSAYFTLLEMRANRSGNIQKAKQLLDDEEEDGVASVDHTMDDDSMMSTDEDVQLNGVGRALLEDRPEL